MRVYGEGAVARMLAALDEVEDRTIQMYLPAVREELARVDGRAIASTRRA